MSKQFDFDPNLILTKGIDKKLGTPILIIMIKNSNSLFFGAFLAFLYNLILFVFQSQSCVCGW